VRGGGSSCPFSSSPFAVTYLQRAVSGAPGENRCSELWARVSRPAQGSYGLRGSGGVVGTGPRSRPRARARSSPLNLQASPSAAHLSLRGPRLPPLLLEVHRGFLRCQSLLPSWRVPRFLGAARRVLSSWGSCFCGAFPGQVQRGCAKPAQGVNVAPPRVTVEKLPFCAQLARQSDTKLQHHQLHSSPEEPQALGRSGSVWEARERGEGRAQRYKGAVPHLVKV
jgi:hypothetical protein